MISFIVASDGPTELRGIFDPNPSPFHLQTFKYEAHTAILYALLAQLMINLIYTPRNDDINHTILDAQILPPPNRILFVA